MTRIFLAVLILVLAAAPLPALPPTNVQTLEDATEVLDELSKIPLKSIPPKLLAEANGIAIIPRVVKVGFVLAGRGGRGLVMAREKDGTWGDPVFVNFGAASIGFQAGVESTDVVLVFRQRKSLDRLLDGKGKITLGADVAVAAGPVGRVAAAATDAKLEAEILSYSRSRGLFAGVSFDGAVIRPDSAGNERYRSDAQAVKAAAVLKNKLIEMAKETP
ncbi:MAG: lipid-binding SYLF domain-containing protein [Gemmataceae bacterium]|nr:lipid-binding SYLF domain-containing protein [Gemmataceae bacterium]